MTQADNEIAGIRIASSESREQKFNDEQVSGTRLSQRPSSAPSVLIVLSKESRGRVDPPPRPMSSTVTAKSKSDSFKALSRLSATPCSFSKKQSMQNFTSCIEEDRMLSPIGIIGKRNAMGNTLLHEAVENGHTHDIRSLLESGASVNAANRFMSLQVHIYCCIYVTFLL